MKITLELDDRLVELLHKYQTRRRWKSLDRLVAHLLILGLNRYQIPKNLR